MAATRAWDTKSELTLYSVISTVFLTYGWQPKCQVRVSRDAGKLGAPKTIDFVAHSVGEENKAHRGLLEVKLIPSRAKNRLIDVTRDVEKLKSYKRNNDDKRYILEAGRKPDLERCSLLLSSSGTVRLMAAPNRVVIADVRQTQWGSVLVPI
jgi:hypothetical protein